MRVDNVYKTYRKVTALNGVTLEFGPGVTCLLGKNGAGKSTLVRQIVGIERPNSGRIELNSEDGSVSGRQMSGAMGWLPQAFGYPASMSVVDFVTYAAWLKEFPREQTNTRVREVLDLVDLQNAAQKRLGELSGGMLRRAGLAAAIVHRPACLILDEPTAGLDPVQRAEFHRRILDFGETATILLATHLLEDVQAVASNVVVLDDGKNVWRGTNAELADVGGSEATTVDALRRGLIELVGPESS